MKKISLWFFLWIFFNAAEGQDYILKNFSDHFSIYQGTQGINVYGNDIKDNLGVLFLKANALPDTTNLFHLKGLSQTILQIPIFQNGFISNGSATFQNGFNSVGFATFQSGFNSVGAGTFQNGFNSIGSAYFQNGFNSIGSATFQNGFNSIGSVTFQNGFNSIGSATFQNGLTSNGPVTFNKTIYNPYVLNQYHNGGAGVDLWGYNFNADVITDVRGGNFLATNKYRTFLFTPTLSMIGDYNIFCSFANTSTATQTPEVLNLTVSDSPGLVNVYDYYKVILNMAPNNIWYVLRPFLSGNAYGTAHYNSIEIMKSGNTYSLRTRSLQSAQSGTYIWMEVSPLSDITSLASRGNDISTPIVLPTAQITVAQNGIYDSNGNKFLTAANVSPSAMTTAQKNAIASPAQGLIVFDTTLHALSYFSGTAWKTAIVADINGNIITTNKITTIDGKEVYKIASGWLYVYVANDGSRATSSATVSFDSNGNATVTTP